MKTDTARGLTVLCVLVTAFSGIILFALGHSGISLVVMVIGVFTSAIFSMQTKEAKPR